MLFIPTFVTNAWQLLSGPSLDRILRRLWPMMLAVVVVTLGSAALLVRVDRTWSRGALGVALVVYAAYALLAPVFRVQQRRERWLGPLVGALSGCPCCPAGLAARPATCRRRHRNRRGSTRRRVPPIRRVRVACDGQTTD